MIAPRLIFLSALGWFIGCQSPSTDWPAPLTTQAQERAREQAQAEIQTLERDQTSDHLRRAQPLAHAQPRRFALDASPALSDPERPTSALSVWSPLSLDDHSELTLESLWRELGSAARARGPLPRFPERASLCLTRSDAVHLALRGDLSPALNFPRPPRGAPHRALFILDLDAPRSAERSGDEITDELGRAPAWLNRGDPPNPIRRAPMLLWALDQLPSALTSLPEGFGGRGLQLNGKPAREVRLGSPWLNDYTHWFYTPAARGEYTGYDGPCVAWNDPLQHHRVIALMIASPVEPERAERSHSRAHGRTLLASMLSVGTWYSARMWITAGSTATPERLRDELKSQEAR